MRTHQTLKIHHKILTGTQYYDADEAYYLFQSILLTVYNEHFPIQTENISNRGLSKPWITAGIQAAIRRKRRLEKKVYQNLKRFLTEYRMHIYLLTKVTRTAREQYYHIIFLRVIFEPSKRKASPLIKLNGIIIIEPKVIASSYISYFNSIPTTLSNNVNNNILTSENYLVDKISEAENVQPSSIPEITKIIKIFKQSNSVGWDNIPTTILKSNINILEPILSNVINKSLATGLFPKSLKRAKILPIFKNKDTLDIINYSQILILPVISKVYGKDFYNRLNNYFSVNNLLSSSQFGFRSGAST